MKRLMIIPIVTLSMLSGCAEVKPWQRSTLMARTMQRGTVTLETSMNNHVHSTRESAQGATSGGSASCGCN